MTVVRLNEVLRDSTDLIRLMGDQNVDQMLSGDTTSRQSLRQSLNRIMQSELAIWNAWAHGLDIRFVAQNFDQPLRAVLTAADSYWSLLDASKHAAVPMSFYWSLILFAFLGAVGVVWPSHSSTRAQIKTST